MVGAFEDHGGIVGRVNGAMGAALINHYRSLPDETLKELVKKREEPKPNLHEHILDKVIATSYTLIGAGLLGAFGSAIADRLGAPKEYITPACLTSLYMLIGGLLTGSVALNINENNYEVRYKEDDILMREYRRRHKEDNPTE